MTNATVLTSIWSQYNTEISPVFEDLLGLAILAEKQFLKATQSLLNADPDAAQQVITLNGKMWSDKINVDCACMSLLSKMENRHHSGEVTSILKVGSNFLGIGYEAEKLARKTFQLQDMEYPRYEYEQVWAFGENICAKLKDTSRAFLGLNEDIAKRVLSCRTEIEEVYENSLRPLISFMAEKPRYIGLTLIIMSITHSFAAVWEYACDVCKQIIKLSRQSMGTLPLPNNLAVEIQRIS